MILKLGLLEAETIEAWSWFMEGLDPPPKVIYSDESSSIEEAI